MSEQIQPGTPVRVVIDGKYDMGKYTRTRAYVVTAKGDYEFDLTDPAVTVTPLDPERPTLDLETLASTISESVGRYPKDTRTIQDAAKAVLALIQAAHPEWTS